MRHEKGDTVPNILIKSNHFQIVPSNVFMTFFNMELTSEEKYFTFFNADMFYHVYGLWGNFSNKAIRVEVKDIKGLEHS